jgi:YHS domain-containing protein
MFRTLIYLLISLLLITFIRMVIGIIMRGMREAMNEQSATGRTQPRPPAGPAGGELKRDPVCGTFVPATTAFQKIVHGQQQYFCSAECRDKFA